MDNEHDKLLTPGQVAKTFSVDPKTVTRWAKDGKLSSIRTPGGHRRFRRSAVDAFLIECSGDAYPPTGPARGRP